MKGSIEERLQLYEQFLEKQKNENWEKIAPGGDGEHPENTPIYTGRFQGYAEALAQFRITFEEVR